jgi:hypothetical protein
MLLELSVTVTEPPVPPPPPAPPIDTLPLTLVPLLADNPRVVVLPPLPPPPPTD